MACSLFGRLLPLFVGARRVEDLFTEAVARLFERRPGLCLSWLDDLDLITPVSGENQRYIRITTQRSFMALDEHGSGSRPDLIVEVHHAGEDAELESPKDVVMIESKIGTWEGPEQLRRYAEHLNEMMHLAARLSSMSPVATIQKTRRRFSRAWVRMSASNNYVGTTSTVYY